MIASAYAYILVILMSNESAHHIKFTSKEACQVAAEQTYKLHANSWNNDRGTRNVTAFCAKE